MIEDLKVLDSIEGFKEAKEFWISRLSENENIVQLPTDFARGFNKKIKSSKFSIDKELSDKLIKISKNNNIMIYIVLLTALSIKISKYANHDKVKIGIPIYGPIDDTSVLNDSLIITSYLNNEKKFKDHLITIKKELAAVLKYQIYPLEKILKSLKQNREVTALIPISIAMKNIHDEKYINNILRDLNNEITYLIDNTKDGIDLEIIYNSKLFNEKTINKFYKEYMNILKQVSDDIDIAIEDINMFCEEEINLINKFNSTEADYPKDKTIHKLFEEQVEKTPNNTAIVFKNDKLTYKELNDKADNLAKVLIANGVKTESIVSIVLHKSIETIVSILAILKSGGAYLPIDPSYPKERIEYIISDSRPQVLITKDYLIENLNLDLTIIDLDKEYEYSNKEMEDYSEFNISNPQNLAYIIYTSGTTGKPKGVMIEHRNVVRLMKNSKMKFDFNDRDVWTMFHSYCFDFSVWEMYGALLYGGKLIIVPKEVSRDTKEYLRLLKHEKVTILNQIPTPFYKLMKCELESKTKELNLRYIIFGGEALKPKMLRQWIKKYENTKIINMYGITETTVHVTYKEITKSDVELDISNIGVPIPTLKTYIMDRNFKMQPIGAIGEICVEGDGVARGYLNNNDLTKKRFVESYYDKTKKIYKTGDMGRWLTNGEIEYIGRVDNQVKIRGFRIEMGEIESQLLSYPNIQEVIVLDKEDKAKEKYLCAYIVSQSKINIGELRDYLKKVLPDYMIPSYFILLDKIPQTYNGKIDKNLLPIPDNKRNVSIDYVEPRNRLEEQLIQIWKEVLLIEDDIGIKDDFFELGGHSLKATEIAAKIYKEMNVEIALNEFFNHTTVEELGELISNTKVIKYETIKKIQDRDYYPVSSIQKRMYITNQIQLNNTNYNMPIIVEADGEFDVNKLQDALNKLIARHESLRTRFAIRDGEIVQYIEKEAKIKFEFLEYEKNLENTIKKGIKPFDLGKSPLIRASVVNNEKDKYILILDMHHIVSDGISMQVIMKELIMLYKQEELEEIKLQYRDYSVWQNELQKTEKYEKQRDYWVNKFKDFNYIKDLPLDYPRGNSRSFNGKMKYLDLTHEETIKLKDFAKSKKTSMFITLFSIYKMSLFIFTGNNESIVGTPISGRKQEEIFNMIGVFINTLTIKNTINEEMTFLDILREVSESIMEAYNNQDFQFDNLIEELDIEINKNRNPLFDTLFAYQDISEKEIYEQLNQGLEKLKISPFKLARCESKFDIKLVGYEKNSKLKFYVEYCSDLFKEESINDFCEIFMTLLREVVINSEIKSSNLLNRTYKKELDNFNDDLENEY